MTAPVSSASVVFPFRPARQTLQRIHAVLALVFALLVYGYGLDSQHVPKNGDEYVYTHITRLTAQHGHWLPLQSELDQMRNTKPPLLFWQGIASTGWGADWTLTALRWPNTLYTLLTAAMIFLLTWRLTVRQAAANGATPAAAPDSPLSAALFATLSYLAFFSTYRFGRPYLTNAPEIFWLFAPFAVLLWGRPHSFVSRWQIPLLLGTLTGIGLLYKSFALLAPVGCGLALWYLHQRQFCWRDCLRADSLKLLQVAVLALGLFALWFVLDPEPQAIWREFVVGENAGKFDPHGGGYVAKLLWGPSSLWSQLAGYPMNAGLLALPVFALAVLGWQQRRCLSADEQLLWLWLIALLVFFCLPSQRSSRYLLDAMPALAILLALRRKELPRWVFGFSLLSCGLVIAVFFWLSWHLQQALPDMTLYAPWYWALLAGSLLLGGMAWWRQDWTRPLTLIVILAVYLGYAAFLRPFDAPLGSYDAAARTAVQGKTVWVPYNFNAKYERYRFMLPGADIQGYREDWNLTPDDLRQRYRWFVVQQPLFAAGHNKASRTGLPDLCAGCRIMGQRLDLHSHHNNREIRAMLAGQVLENLFVREWLVAVATDADAATAGDGKP